MRLCLRELPLNWAQNLFLSSILWVDLHLILASFSLSVCNISSVDESELMLMISLPEMCIQDVCTIAVDHVSKIIGDNLLIGVFVKGVQNFNYFGLCHHLVLSCPGGFCGHI